MVTDRLGPTRLPVAARLDLASVAMDRWFTEAVECVDEIPGHNHKCHLASARHDYRGRRHHSRFLDASSPFRSLARRGHADHYESRCVEESRRNATFAPRRLSSTVT